MTHFLGVLAIAVSVMYHILETSFVGPALVSLWKRISPENSLDPFVAEAEFKEYRECCMRHSI